MTQSSKDKIYDLEERTLHFAGNVALYCKGLPKSISNTEYARQVIRSSGSVGANYIEANESLSKKDFAMRLKISRKEAKETCYWLRLIIKTNSENFAEKWQPLLKESTELKKILSSIITKL